MFFVVARGGVCCAQDGSLERLMEYAAGMLRSPSESTQKHVLMVREEEACMHPFPCTVYRNTTFFHSRTFVEVYDSIIARTAIVTGSIYNIIFWQGERASM